MKHILIIILLFQLVSVKAQSYLKAADREEYAKYVKWCEDSITVEVVQYGKATVIKHEFPGFDYQLFKAMNGEYSPTLLKDTFWYKTWEQGKKTPAISLNSDQVLLHRVVKIKIQRYKPSVKHYYLIREQWRNL